MENWVSQRSRKPSRLSIESFQNSPTQKRSSCERDEVGQSCDPFE